MWKKYIVYNGYSSFSIDLLGPVSGKIQVKNARKGSKNVRQGGIEPPAKPWKGFMLPLHH